MTYRLIFNHFSPVVVSLLGDKINIRKDVRANEFLFSEGRRRHPSRKRMGNEISA